VLAAFAATAAPVRLAGGKNGTWRSGDVVLKPAEGAAETIWRCGVLDRMPDSPGFRIARPLRSTGGGWLADGWEAARFVAGHADPRRADDVIIGGEAFHQAIAALPRPSFLDTRTDPWAYGDRLAWDSPSSAARGDRLAGDSPGAASAGSFPLLESLLVERRPVTVTAQLVHGDLLGNVLFADGLPPAIIDWPAYWRPPGWASAVAVVDALCWHGVDPGVLDRWSHLREWRQMLIRALIFRIGTSAAAGGAGEPDSAYVAVVRRVVAFRG
jgi:uncharacterized protein (TIGR02569 family)